MSLLHLALYLLGYCALHSWLASERCKQLCGQRWPRLMPAYRLLYNLLAMVLLLPLGYLFWRASGPLLWQWSGGWRWLMDGLALLALAGFVSSLKDYDLGQFSGTAQWRQGQKEPEQQTRLRIGGWHRWVRHPWYCFALVLIWTRSMDAAQLLTSVLLTLYLVVGSWLEERKLEARFGSAYRRYRAAVPGLLPWPGRQLSRAQADELERSAHAP